MIPIHQRIIDINTEQSQKYVEAEAARRRYWAEHRTFFACVKCMDGRVLFPTMTNTPVGIVKPLRAIGGKFSVWWPSFLGRIRHWTDRAMSQGSQNFIFVTYHYSASDSHLGCAGWGYDTAAARAHAERLQRDLAYVFGEQLTAVVAGVETDRDILTLHGVVDVSGEHCIGKTAEEVMALLREAFPAMSDHTIADVLPFMLGNATRVKELTDTPRDAQDKGHNERVIALGQSFDWMASENLALIINDADPNLAESVRVAASLIRKNLEGTDPSDGATIFTSIPYREPGTDYRQAVARAKGLLEFGQKVVQEAYPDLMASGRLHGISSVMWEPSKKIEIIEEK